AASQAFREARWTLPAAPLDFPEHITRVFGNLRLRHGDYIHALAYRPDGGRLATASADGSVKIWDIGNGRELRNYRGHPEAVRAVVFAPDGKTVASAAANEIKICDPETGNEVRTIAAHAGGKIYITCLAYSPDGKLLASGSNDKTVKIWDPASGTQ